MSHLAPARCRSQAILLAAIFSLLGPFLLTWQPVHQALAAETPPPGRFFLMGSGKLDLHNVRNGRRGQVELLTATGEINEEALNTVDWIFGFPTAEKGEHISPRLLFQLSYFADQVAGDTTIHIESAYRSPDYNAKIRSKGANAARTSTHIDGLALDFWIEGVNGKELWHRIRAEACCGTGHYGGKTVHLDAGRPRFWEAATSGTRDPEPDYNRHVYLSPLYDRYYPGESVRLSLSGVSDFSFGIKPVLQLLPVGEPGALPATPLALVTASAATCLAIENRRASRFLSVALPAALPPGRYQFELTFCDKVFAQMPDSITSREIEILP